LFSIECVFQKFYTGHYIVTLCSIDGTGYSFTKNVSTFFYNSYVGYFAKVFK